MNFLLIVLQAQSGDTDYSFFIMMVVIFCIMYFFMIRKKNNAETVEFENSNTTNSLQNIKKEEFNDSINVCPFCNNFINAEDVFCVHCGKKLPDNKESSDTKVCPKCKTPIGENDLFCSNCGEAL